ncbi:MAG: DUF4364 family protein [Clostridia bacterium]|nr:DUF4364 family protein [Clostridia bacterium]
MEPEDNILVNKLMLLFVFDKMGIPITEKTLLEMCASRNSWINYMESIECLGELVDAGFVFKTTNDRSDYYTITTSGRECLDSFFTRIPASKRAEITEYIKENRMMYKRAQEYSRGYYKNEDGSYTVQLKIVDPTRTTMELKLNVANRAVAKSVYGKWDRTAAEVYSMIYEKLID